MKPKIKLLMSWGDCGHDYEWWSCGIEGQQPVGFGPTKEAAYRDWLAKGGKA